MAAMQIIYQPKGPAAEYAPLACNLYRGCTFGCRYCYGPASMRKSPQAYFADPDPKHNAAERLMRDLCRMSGDDLLDDRHEILLSFIGDPYQPAEAQAGLTRRALRMLAWHGANFTVLTKAGQIVRRDFDYLSSPKARLGVSLVWCCDDDNRRHWEPGAAPVKERIALLESAKKRGIRTWVSMEPVINPEQCLRLIRDIAPLVDEWRVGKLNHFAQVTKMVDWRGFKEQAQELLEMAGAKYTFKNSLKMEGGIDAGK